MIETFIDRIIVREGGFVDHPDDRGGPTKYGISIYMHDPAGTYSVPVRANQVDDVPIHPKAQSSINYNSISIVSEGADAVPQEKCFVTLLGKSWNDGCNIWRDGKRFIDKEKYASGLKLPANTTTSLKNYYYDKKEALKF